MNAARLVVGTKVETTHHTTGHHKWLPAEVVKLTAHFVDIKTEGRGVERYRIDTQEARSAYCGFRSQFRLASLKVGDRVEAGKPGTEDYDTGKIVAITGDSADVAWDTRVITWCDLASLRLI